MAPAVTQTSISPAGAAADGRLVKAEDGIAVVAAKPRADAFRKSRRVDWGLSLAGTRGSLEQPSNDNRKENRRMLTTPVLSAIGFSSPPSSAGRILLEYRRRANEFPGSPQSDNHRVSAPGIVRASLRSRRPSAPSRSRPLF